MAQAQAGDQTSLSTRSVHFLSFLPLSLSFEMTAAAADKYSLKYSMQGRFVAPRAALLRLYLHARTVIGPHIACLAAKNDLDRNMRMPISAGQIPKNAISEPCCLSIRYKLLTFSQRELNPGRGKKFIFQLTEP